MADNQFTQDQLLDWYRQAVLIRRIEEEANTAYGKGFIGGYQHLYIGQETIAIGAMAALRPEDSIVTHYRDHGHGLARGMDPKAVMAELYGRTTGVSKGKGGSMHLAQADLNFWGGYAIVSAHLSLAAGIALADQYKGRQAVTICIFGDGATNNGYFHESLNMAQLWKLPVIFMVENNLYGMGTPVERASAVTEMYRKACGYDMASERIEGHDPRVVYETVSRAAEHARSGKGPYFLEVLTYRFSGHGAGDNELYRNKEEVEKARQRDPVVRFRELLQQEYKATEEQLAEIEQRVEQVVQEAVRFAEESPVPADEELWTDIFVKPIGENRQNGR